MSFLLYSLFADRIQERCYEGFIRRPTICCIETGAILLLSTNVNVVGETCLANPLQRSGFQAARHSMFIICLQFINR
jgi:hypothetical protein